MNFEYDLAFDWLVKTDQIAEWLDGAKKEEKVPTHDESDSDEDYDGKAHDED